MPRDSFVHLHLHTEYSLLDGAVRMRELMNEAVKMKMPAVAITDHGNLFGAIDFYQCAKAAGIKPIIGCEAYITSGSYKEKPSRESTFHFTLLAENETGYHNLVKLISAAHLDGFYYRPRIDKNLLASHADGLIGLSGCLASEINSALQSGNVEKAQNLTAEYRDISGRRNFFLGLHDHGMAEQKQCNAHLPQFAREFRLGFVAAIDVHFLRRSDHRAHDVLLCINTATKIEDEQRMRYEPELYFKSPAEMREIFRDFPEAITNTLKIADRCNLEIEFGKSKYPEYPVPAGKTREGYLRELCYKGLHERYGERAANDQELIKRLDYEVDVLEKTGFVSYLLIVWDFIHFARERGIPVGPGRGSAAGSIVAYVLGITDIDPLQYGLIFERFLIPERISSPDRDLSEYVPLCRDVKGNDIVSQYSMNPLNDLGLLKMDFLGLKTLTVIEDTANLIRKTQPKFEIKDIPLDDQKAFDLYNRGETIGLFQMESGGITSVSKQFDVRKLDDIIALIALYRPGPMELIGDYIKRKKGLTKIRYEHPLLEEICADTYGVMIYQEQVMAAASKLAGYSMGQADLLRRAMGKKDKEKMAKERANFIAGCARTNEIGEKKANAIFDLLEKFAGYGFNKSHSAAYALISYQTAFLKANHPVEFMAGLLSNEINNTEKISVLVSECKRMGITILPPDVNRSGLKFVPEAVAAVAGRGEIDADDGMAAPSDRGDKAENGGHRPPRQGNAIRFGLAAIKNVGQGAMELAIRERERGGDFKSLEDFCSRLDSRIANRKMLESLVKCGAFEFLHCERAELFACIDDALASSAVAHRDRMAGQVSLFGDSHEHVAPARTRTVMPWSDREKMSYEKELLGFYVTGHPLDAYADVIANGKYQSIAALNELSDRATFRLAGAITQVDKKFTRKEGKPFAVVWLEDLTGTLELVVWNELYLECAEKLVPGNVVGVRGKLDLRDESLRSTAEKLRLLSLEVPRNPNPNRVETPPLCLHFSPDTGTDELREVRALLAASPGRRPVQLIFETAEGETVRVDAGAAFYVSVTAELKEQLRHWLITAVEERAREAEQGRETAAAVPGALEY